MPESNFFALAIIANRWSPYERVSSFEQAIWKPNDPELAGLGPGRFRITLECVNRFDARTFTTETQIDGIHDSEIQILAE